MELVQILCPSYPCKLPGVCLPRACSHSPSLGFVPPVKGEGSCAPLAPYGRPHSSHGCQGHGAQRWAAQAHTVIYRPQTTGCPCICQVRSLLGSHWPLQTSYLYEMQ